MCDAARDPDDEASLAFWEAEMRRYVAHEGRRLQLIALVLESMALLIAVGHARADGGAIAGPPRGVFDLVAGYPTAIALALIAGCVWHRASLYRPSRRQARRDL
jgi:hypothetical protein